MANFKATKIRDQGMEKRIFVVRFQICLRGVVFKIMDPFLCFSVLTLFVKSLEIRFLRISISISKILTSKNQFKVLKKLQKVSNL